MSIFYKCYLKIIVLVFLIFNFSYSIGIAKNKKAATKLNVLSQDTVKGIVLDNDGKPLANSTISLSGRSITTRSGIDGLFSIPAAIGDMCTFSHAGFYDLRYTVSSTSKKLVIRLKENYLNVQDSINVLYGKKSVNSLVGAVSTIYTNQLTSAPVPSLLTALAGRLPGLNMGQSNGLTYNDGDGQSLTPGISASIRGYTGQTSNGSELLVLIDGSPRPYSSIDPEEVESVTVLKDAISTVMYGQRSTPGMLLITTKKGQNGATRMAFTAETGIQSPLNFSQSLSAYDYAVLYNQTQINSGVPTSGVKYSAAALNAYQNGTDPYLFPDVNWKDVILKNTTSRSKYNLNLQGSGTGVHYFVSLDYLNQGALFNTASFNNYNTSPNYNRYIARSNVGIDFNKTLTLDLGLFGRIQDQTQPGNNDMQGIINAIITTPALAYPVNNPNGTYGGNSTYNTNLYARDVQSGYSLTNTKDLSFDIALTQKLDKLLAGLYIKASGNVNISNSYFTQRNKTYAVVPVTASGTGTGYTYGTALGTNTDVPNPGTGSALFRQTSSYMEALAGYEHTFEDQSLSVKLVANQQSSTRDQSLPVIYNNFAANVAYSYKQKYFVEAAGSYGSFNQFAPSQKYAPFYAAGIGWNLANENLIKDKISWLSNLKLRANYGITGYVNRANYGYFSYIQRYNTTGTYYYFGTSAAGIQGYAESSLANAEAAGEKAKKLNAGIDIGLLKNHLSFTADYFVNDLYDIWITPGSTFQVLGSGYPAQNIGKQKYFGSEFSATYKNNIKSFNYFLTLNLSAVSSRLVYSAEAPAENGYQLLTGQPVGIFSGLTAIGLFRSQAAINTAAIPTDVSRSSIQPGDIQYADRNNDGVIDSKDVGPVGSAKPTMFYGATIGFSFKGIDFNMLIQGVQNRQVYLSGDYEWAFRNSGLNTAFPNSLNAYSSNNPDSNYPRLTIGTNLNNEKASTFWLHDAGFVRLKNAEVGYTFPSELTAKIKIPSARIFINGENLLTVSQLDDFGTKRDPEVYGSNYPLQRTINFGINIKL